MDYIDKRNQREKIAKSIIKRWNVRYTVPQPLPEAKSSKDQAAEDKAMEILDRLAKEQQADEDKKRQEIEELLKQQELNQEEINRILQEKRNMLERTMDNAGREL